MELREALREVNDALKVLRSQHSALQERVDGLEHDRVAEVAARAAAEATVAELRAALELARADANAQRERAVSAERWSRSEAFTSIGRQIRQADDPAMRLGKDGERKVPDERVRETLAEHAAYAYRHGLAPEHLIWRGVGVGFEHGQAAEADPVAESLLIGVRGFHAVLVAEHREYRIPIPAPQSDNLGAFADQVFTVVSEELSRAATTWPKYVNRQELKDRMARTAAIAAGFPRGNAIRLGTGQSATTGASPTHRPGVRPSRDSEQGR